MPWADGSGGYLGLAGHFGQRSPGLHTEDDADGTARIQALGGRLRSEFRASRLPGFERILVAIMVELVARSPPEFAPHTRARLVLLGARARV